jgi:hypothetical protein
MRSAISLSRATIKQSTYDQHKKMALSGITNL